MAATTLGAVESAVAARTGPYQRNTASGGTIAQVVVPEQQSTVDVGGLTNLWVLRRGVTAGGAAVAGFDAGDRQRRVKLVTRASGTVDVDRSWANAPVADEVVEFVYLDPAQELRPAVLRGLTRCYVADRVPLALVGAAGERDLTASLAWLTAGWQVLGLAFAGPTVVDAPVALPFWRVTESAGAVLVRAWPDPFPQTLYVTALRPADTLVNGADSTTGPTADADTLPVDLEYAARAGHAEAWRSSKARMVQAAASGLTVSQQEAADEFTTIALARVGRRQRRVGYAEPVAPDLVASGRLVY